VSELIENIKNAWKGLSRGKRGLVVVLALAVIGLAAGAGTWSLRANYQVLFADLDLRDAGTIIEELKRMKVPYRVADGGAKILVDDAIVHETRIHLMSRGVPLGGTVGFEIFDNKDVGMTEYTQKINYQRALQGELARTISSIEVVKHARVHLAVGEASLFKRQKMKPKASVSLVLKPGAALAGEQITGIQRLVSAAVPGLEPSAVTVLDQAGVALSGPIDENEDYAQATGKLRLKKNAEEYFVGKITRVLDRTFGPGRAIVSVDVTLNFDEVRRTQQTVLPLNANTGSEAGAVVRRRQSVYRDGKAPVTRTVNGDAQYAGSSALTSTTDVEYEFGKTVEQVVSSPGGVRRISVGVVVPKMSDEQIQRARDIVRMIIGYNVARGDAISVEPIMMAVAAQTSAPAKVAGTPPADAPAAPSAGATWFAAMPLGWMDARRIVADTLIAAIGIFAGIVIAVSWLRRRPRSQPPVEPSVADPLRDARLAEIKSWLATERKKEPV